MDINIIAAMEAAELVLERMSLEKGGRGGLLVNTASLAGVSFLSLSTSSLQVNCLCLSCQHYSSCIFGDSSVAGIAHGWKQDLHSYFASKHAVVSMTRTLGSDNVFKETGVKVHLHLFILRCNCFQYWELVPSNITYIAYQQCHQSSASLAIPLKSSPPPPAVQLSHLPSSCDLVHSGPVYLPLFCGHCNLKRQGRGKDKQGHAGEDLRHPHRGGGLRGIHAAGRELWQWCCCHRLQGDFFIIHSGTFKLPIMKDQ